MNLLHEIRDPASNKLLHFVIRASEQSVSTSAERVDLVEAENFLQVASMSIPAGTKYRAHIHLERDRFLTNIKAQESWVVLHGQIRANFFGEDGNFIESMIVGPGEATFTLHGGHSYEAMEDAIVLEYKSGPYEGQEVDKRFID